MARKLLNPVSRDMALPVFGKQFVVTLHPGDMVGFRKRRGKKEYMISLHDILIPAIRNTVREDYQEALKEYNRKRKLGVSCRKPKRPTEAVYSKYIQREFK